MKYSIILVFKIFLITASNLLSQDMSSYSINSTTEPLLTQKTENYLDINRPTAFLFSTDKSSFAIGGLTSGSSQYFRTDGEGDDLYFSIDNFNIFTESNFNNKKITFKTNIGYNTNNNNFQIQEATLNIEFTSFFNLKGGVILPPLGRFNRYGDSPKRYIIDAPLVSTTIIPSTYSDIGFGISGLIVNGKKIGITYEILALNGLQDGITNNDIPRTFIPLGRPDNIFDGDNNNSLAVVGRLGFNYKGIGSFGLSYYNGQYNTTEIDETVIDVPRDLSIFAIDGSFKLANIKIEGEVAWASIDVFEGLGQLFGSKKNGYYVEVSYPIFNNLRLLENYQNSLNMVFRYESVDYNIGDFEQTNTNIFDQVHGIKTGFGLQLGEKTTLKANYTYMINHDILGNKLKTGGIQTGFATYF